MRHLHDIHDSLAAPSPIVPTARTRLPSKAKPLFPQNMSASATRLPASVANGEVDSKPLRLLGIISDDVADSHKKDEDMAADLIRCLQSPSAVSAPASASASASTASLLTSATTGTGARGMLKAGHRRLRQLAQRQRKDIDLTDSSRADDDARQLSALQQEGLLPASAATNPGPRRRNAKKESVDSTATLPSISNTSYQSNSRRDVERIGQPWLADPLEHCMLDPVSPGARLSSLDLGDLTSFMDTAMSLDSTLGDAKPQQSSAQEIPSQNPATIDSHEHAQPLLSETKPQTQTQTKTTPEPLHNNPVEPSDKAKTHDNERAPRPSHNLKLFPGPLPPRISSKAARRLSKGPPVSNGAQPAAAAGPQHALTPLAELPSPVSKQSSNEPRSVPASTGQFADAEEKPENQNSDQKNSDHSSSLPMHAIKAFPLPAPTRPLPALPELATNSTGAHTVKANPKRNGRASPSPLEFRSAMSPPPVREGSPQSTESARPNPPGQHAPSSGLRLGDLAEVAESTGADENRENVRASRCNGMSTHLQVTSPGERQSRSFEAASPQEAPPRSPSPASSPPPLFSGSPGRSSNRTHAGRTLPSKQSDPTLTSAPCPSSQVRRSNSFREEPSSKLKRDLRSEYPIPSSDDEGIDLRTNKSWGSNSQKKRRRTRPSKTFHNPNRLSRVSRVENPDTMDPLSPQDASSSFDISSPLSQYSQSMFRSHDDSHTLTTLEKRIAQLERQNKILQAALLAALDVGMNSNASKESTESILSETVASTLSAAPSSKTTPTSSLDDHEGSSESGGYSSSRQKKDNIHPSRRRDTWLDLDTRSRSSSDAQSSNLSTRDKALEGINGVDFGWASDRSSLVH